MTTGSLASPEGGTHDPEHREDDGRNPQEVDCEPSSEQNQNQQQSKYEQHEI
ncbi:MAG TPA: hypothetical protein VG346_03115 [Acidimicrobiales bacterium]|nr:hypothetical protein [Acidimicrobiales bacterium]